MMLLFVATVFPAVAHNDDVATYTLRDTGAGWLVEMNFAQARLDAAMIKQHGNGHLDRMAKKDYQHLIVEYVKSNFSLKVDGKEVELGHGGIIIGSNQTDLKFIIPDIPLQPVSASVQSTMFEESEDYTNILSIYRSGQTIAKFYLNEDNDYSVDLIFTSQGVFEQSPKPKDDQLLMLGSGGIFLAMVMGIILFSRKKLKP